MIRDEIADLVREAAAAAQAAGELPSVALPEVEIERPRQAENGDYATSLPLRLKKAIGGPGAPITIAQTIVRHLRPSPMIREAVAAPPGFVNFWLADEWLQRQVEAIVRSGAGFAGG